MTTFTRSAAGEMPKISVHADRRISKINRNIYSGFTEHMGRCIYGGLYDPDNPNKNLVDSNGFRKDVLEALRPLQIPVVRYPGGNFCATYHWLDGVGPRENRPARPELAWEGVETNQFGTDEFMTWCEALGTEPYLCFNFGTGTLDEAIGWLEYCNSNRNTYHANLRRKNGHEKPYGVKYWALGNEMWGPWQIGESCVAICFVQAHKRPQDK
jgi:alpha-N-arabinofuranosidase